MKNPTGLLFLLLTQAIGCSKGGEGSLPKEAPTPARTHTAAPLTNPPSPALGKNATSAGTTPPGAQAPDASVGGPSTEEACVDKWLADHHLDPYGHPQGTLYAGGSPLFDERTGRTEGRLEHVYAQQPEAKKACAPSAPSSAH